MEQNSMKQLEKELENVKILIESKELMELVLSTIQNPEELKKVLAMYQDGDNQTFKTGFMAGMALASLMTAKCRQYYTRDFQKEGEQANEQKV